MGWSEVAARHHARRLEREGWLERCPMIRGQGSLFLATRTGVRVLGLPVVAATTPAATWWAHHSACAWTAAWGTVRGRRYLGPRELLVDPHWSGRLHWRDRHSAKRSGHRPDLVAFVSDQPIPIEVELANKSKSRLDAILNLHANWIIAHKSAALIYICGDQEGYRRIERAADRVGLPAQNGLLRIELLGTIQEQARTEFERSRTARCAG
jgi:hypothetical protein